MSHIPVVKHIPHTAVVAGTRIGSVAAGWHVVLRDHVTSAQPPKINESNDLYHWVGTQD